MKKKDKKGITDKTISEIGTVSMLLQRVNEEYAKRQLEVIAQDQANRELLTKAYSEEKKLIAEISEAKKICTKMITDYGQIEVDVESATRKGIEENVLRESDVRAGRTSLVEFRKKGKYDKAIAEETLTESTKELESLLPVIRDKNLEILKLKERLGSCQNTIRNLVIKPGIIMREMLKGLYEFTDVQVADFMGELESLRYEWQSAKQEILLAQGKSLSGKNIFQCSTMQEARNLQFNPGLPLKCVEQLKQELLKYNEAGGVTLTLYMNLGEIEVTSITARRGLLQTSQLREPPIEKPKEKARQRPLQTTDIKENVSDKIKSVS